MEFVDTLLIAIPVVQLAIIFGFVLLERRAPAATLAWVLAVALVPVLGAVLYLFFRVRAAKRNIKTWEAVSNRLDEVLADQRIGDGSDVFDDCDERTRQLLRLGNRLATTPATGGNYSDILVNARATYDAMFEAIERARHHVHVEFYIIQPDPSGEALRERLVERARAGVEVRVLADAVGSIALPSEFWDPLIEAGGKAAFFSPVNPLYRLRRRDRIDFRNHRKIVVCDGYEGFTGGINVGKEYLGMNPDLGHWRDTHIRLDGPAVLGLQRTFAEDWLQATDETLGDPCYFPAPKLPVPGADIVQIIDSGPDRARSPIRHVYFQAITSARDRVWVTSPYFVPDTVIEEALITAALRGVDVRLLLPNKSDAWLVGLASRAFYPNLLEAGIRIYEYDRGFIHAKTLVVDDWVGTVGSANMDIRSFRLNYELNAFVYGATFCDELADQFLVDIGHAREITLASQRELGYFQRLGRSFASLLSPLL